MIIGLIGFEFKSANKGCEALVYSFLSIIRNEIEDDLLVYNFSGTELGEIEHYFDNMSFKNIIPKIKDIKLKYIRALAQCDCIFDVTMGDSFSDIYSKDYYNWLVKQKKIAELFCKKYILLPQTYGPFRCHDSFKKADGILRSAYKIYCRDEISQKLLEDKFGIHDSILASDMAFILPYDKDMYKFSKKEKLGINVSGLLYKGGFYSENQFELTLNYPELVDRFISNFIKKYEVHLIPHVIDLEKDSYDDDYKVCKMLHEKYPDTILAPPFENPIQAKSYISNMDIFIGSRMHSTIAAFSSGVVTIPISYSRKFEGLFGSLNYLYVIDARNTTLEEAYDLVIKYVENKAKLAEIQRNSMKLILKKNEEFKKSISNILKEL